MKKKITWKKVVLSIIILFALFIMGVRLNNTYNTGPTGQEATVGEPLRVGHLSYTVNDIELADTIVIEGEERGVNDGAFLIADMTIRNHSFSGTWFFDSNFYIQFNEEYFPPADSLEVGEYAAEQRGKYAFVSHGENIGRRETMEGIIVFMVSDEMIESDDISIYIYTETWGEQDGAIHLDLNE